MSGCKELGSTGGGGRSFRWKDCLAEMVETFWALIFDMMVGFFFSLSDVPICCHKNSSEMLDRELSKLCLDYSGVEACKTSPLSEGYLAGDPLMLKLGGVFRTDKPIEKL